MLKTVKNRKELEKFAVSYGDQLLVPAAATPSITNIGCSNTPVLQLSESEWHGEGPTRLHHRVHEQLPYHNGSEQFYLLALPCFYLLL